MSEVPTVEVPATRIVEKKADSRGRVTLGAEYANADVHVAIVAVDTNGQVRLADFEDGGA